ncbi:MAG: putative bifunctional diguanylate cyclase/phosphodiesterase, partial [Candidatus Levyibacteriota bacterium]
MRRRVREHLAPLAADTGSQVELPPIRTRLATKFNLLTIGLIALTAVAVTAFVFYRQWVDDERQLRVQGETLSLMLADLSAYGLRNHDRSSLAQILGSLPEETNFAYVYILDAQRKVVAERYLAPALRDGVIPALEADEVPEPTGPTLRIDRVVPEGRFLELVTPVASLASGFGRPLPDPRNATQGPATGDAAPRTPLGYVRLGMTFDLQRALLGNQLQVALAVVGVLLIIAVATTLLLSRRLVAPMRRLIRAARAVGAGRLDVRVPVRSSDELGLLSHAFNHMTKRLAHSQSEVANYQRTLEEKVAQRTRELEVATAHAFKLAQHDILTGLPNRSLLNQRLTRIIGQAQRDGTQVGCLFLDFDHFKRINDTLGHDAGDQLLKSIAQRLGGATRESDTVARLGGDEFVVVLPGLDPAHASFEVLAVIQRIRESLLAPFRLADQTPTLTCSIGVAIYPLDAHDGNTLIKQADTAMYAAKDGGRNAYRFFEAEMNARVAQRLQIETDMRRALMDDEFFLVYQPQIEMRTGRACGVEALLRWRDPERGVISPAEFIPIAEESGMIQALGARVLRDACHQIMKWHRQDLLLRLSVNLSVQQLQHEDWLATVEEALRASGLPSHSLDLEITESIIITHPERAVATLMKLKQMGVSITIDDFGTGYSSLSYLARLPLHGLKIDQRFVHGLGKNANDEAITQAIIAMAHSLNLRCIAEGVETTAQSEFLR